jgi:hypothetical protein
MKLKYFFLLLFGALAGVLYGQDKQHSSTDISNKVFFRLGEKQLDLGYMNNGKSLDVLIKDLNALAADSNYIVSKLRIVGVASPDGRSEAINIDLAQRRAESIKSYIAPRVNLPSSRIEIEDKGENWEGLRELVAASYMPGKKEVLRIIDGVTDRDRRKSRLMFLQGGVPYKYMLKNFFPGLRSGFSISSCYSSVKSINLSNWNQLRKELSTCVLSDADKESLLSIFSQASDSEERLRQMEKLMGGKAFEKVKSNFLSKILFSADSMSVDNWLLLEKMVAASSDIPNKEEVLRLFAEVPVSQGREERLQSLHEGVPYQYMKDHFFSRLLQKTSASDSTGNIVAEREDNWKHLRHLVDTSTMDKREKVDVLQQPSEKALAPATELPSRWALKTNLLYVGVLIPNLEVEYLLSKHWSVNLEGQYAWWSKSEDNKYYQIAAVSPEVRYWLSRQKPFSGHYLGLYYGSGLYDLENGSEGYTGECYLSSGLSYGFMKSLSRHLSLELGFGVGYLSTQYKKYLPVDGRYVYQSTERLNYIGPTKAKISLVWKWSRRANETK